MKVSHVVIALAIVVAGVVAYRVFGNPNANAEAWALGRANATTDDNPYRWNGTSWVRG
jgi:hypothetical protein